MYIFDISLNKYGCHIQNKVDMSNMLHGHIKPKFLHKYAKTKPDETSTLYVFANYVPETNMATRFGIYAVCAQYLICISSQCMCIYVPHIEHVH